MRSKDIIEKKDNNEPIRLNKFLSDAGVCSRREADRLIEEGKVLVDGKKASMGMKIMPGQKVVYKGKEVTRQEKLVLIALNKPEGIECTTDLTNPDNVVDFVGYSERIYPIGRLDKNSKGLLLMTNSGAIVNKIMKAANYHEKEYVVSVNKPIDDEFIKKMSAGVPILDTVTRPCKVTQTGKNTFNIILTQGLNRQIRRMCEYCGYKVISLKRIRIMNIKLGKLKEGTYRNVTDEELNELLHRLK
ncbi:MAG: pseudouridine synthase [Lachnospiraceae bacterium]|nr:pseudouridine synthase [Lachnospiraceae bacterium]